MNKTEKLSFEIKRLSLVPDTYYLTTFIGNNGSPVDWVAKAFQFEVVEGSFYSNGLLPRDGQALALTDFYVK